MFLNPIWLTLGSLEESLEPAGSWTPSNVLGQAFEGLTKTVYAERAHLQDFDD